jgi:hypothetical protein
MGMVQLVLPGFEEYVKELEFDDNFDLKLEPTFSEAFGLLKASLQNLWSNVAHTITTSGPSLQEFSEAIISSSTGIDWSIRDGYIDTGRTYTSTDITGILFDYGGPRGEIPPGFDE